MSPAIGMLAASSKLMLSGFGASLDSRATANSAKAPLPNPKTASPGLNRSLYGQRM
jgi:hypothetical protein